MKEPIMPQEHINRLMTAALRRKRAIDLDILFNRGLPSMDLRVRSAPIEYWITMEPTR